MPLGKVSGPDCVERGCEREVVAWHLFGASGAVAGAFAAVAFHLNRDDVSVSLWRHDFVPSVADVPNAASNPTGFPDCID